MTKRFRAEVALDEPHELAEGALWDAAEQRVLWVDIPHGRVRWGTFTGDRVEPTGEQRFDSTTGVVVPTSDRGLLVALQRRLATLARDGTVRTGSAVVPENDDSRFNDGACDPAGRFLVGSMALDDREGDECLYRVSAEADVEVMDRDLTLSNGLGWSPDGATLYSVDSRPGVVFARGYDAETGKVGPRREHLRITDATPDGLTVDADGNVWVALWGAGAVRCYDTDGNVVAAVEVPAPHTSSAAFVGRDLDRLLITTARKDLSAEQLDQYPRSGRLFVADVGVAGMPATPWAGRCESIT